MGFQQPDWAAQPSTAAALHVEGGSERVAVDQRPCTVFGRDPALADVAIDDASVSRRHAALVHHADSRIYVIDLASREGVLVNGQRIPPNKPTQLKNGGRLAIGPRAWVLRCDGPPQGHAQAPLAQAAAAAAEVDQVRASHLLVKHASSRRPSSWKEPVVTRSEAEALAMVRAFREDLVSGKADFAELARRESHCSSASRGGDLGWFKRGQMQRPFEEATYALRVGDLSGPVLTDSGVHLILRTG